MEDALVHFKTKKDEEFSNVLILVLMEDALVQGYAAFLFNRCES